MYTKAKIIASVAVLGALWAIHEIDKSYAIKEAVAECKKASKEAITRTERATKALEASSVKDKEQLYEKINRISAERDVAVASLRNRPLRSSGPKAPQSTSSCTGRELYREDAEFLTREAARAERIMEERNFYWSEYEKARKELEKIND